MTTTNSFNPAKGDLVFGDNGQQARYVASIDGMHIVQPIYEAYKGDEEEPAMGHPEQWPRVYEREPTAKAGEEVSRLNALAEGLRTEITTMRNEKTAIERDYKARMAKLQRHEKLQRLEDFLDGKLTHYAVFPEYSGPPYVIAVAAAKSDMQDKWCKDLRLLCLFGKSNGDLAWRLNQYYDGSGRGGDEVVPCTSEADANAAICKRAEETWELYRLDPKQFYYAQRMAAASSAGFEVPEDIRAAIKAAEIRSAQGTINEAKKSLATAEEKLAAINAK